MTSRLHTVNKGIDSALSRAFRVVGLRRAASVVARGHDRSFSWLFIVKVVIALGFGLVAQNFDTYFAQPGEAISVAAYLGTIGTLYSVLVAFVVVSVWGRFSDTEAAVKTEARELRELWRFVGYSADPANASAAQAAVERYRDLVVTSEWEAMCEQRASLEADEAFIDMARAVENLSGSTAESIQMRGHALLLLGAAKNARGDRLHGTDQRLPYPLRLLLYLVTVALIVGVLLLPFASLVTSSIIVTLVILVEMLVMEVINDIDNPIGGIWSVTTAPYEQLWFGERSQSRDRRPSDSIGQFDNAADYAAKPTESFQAGMEPAIGPALMLQPRLFRADTASAEPWFGDGLTSDPVTPSTAIPDEKASSGTTQ